MKKRKIGPVRMAIRVVLTVVSLYVALQVFRAYNNVYSTEVVIAATMNEGFRAQGVACFPRALINKHPRPEAVCLELREPHTPWTLSVAYRKGRFITTPMRLFLDMCKE